ncbi:MAG: DUF1295 domain-containing protein [Dehalococcoidia bacterium]
MTRSALQPVAAIIAILVVAALVAAAGSHHGESLGGVRVFALCAGLAFGIQWIVFIPSYVARTEHYFDLTGGFTYITVSVLAVVAVANWEPRSLIIGGLIVVWAARLSSFLFLRVRRSGGDRRFDDLKGSLPNFLMTWTLQGLWVLLTAAAGLAAITTREPKPLEWVALLGIAVWVAGFVIEVVADAQKSAFRSDPENADRFIATGLWSWSRHPNYFGEIVLWVGIAIIAAPVLSGWQWLTLVSPVFVLLLLTRISGIPMLERRAHRRWGEDAAYQEYRRKTPVLVPRPPR